MTAPPRRLLLRLSGVTRRWRSPPPRNLAEYAEALVDAGYDDVQFLLEMSDDKIETILTEAGMAKVGHRKRFVSCVRKLRAAAA